MEKNEFGYYSFFPILTDPSSKKKKEGEKIHKNRIRIGKNKTTSSGKTVISLGKNACVNRQKN